MTILNGTNTKPEAALSNDIVVKDLKFKTAKLIDISIPSDYNVVTKETEKISKYCDLSLECQRMWNVKPEIIPVIIGATVLVTKNTYKYLDKLPGKIRLDMVQKVALLGTVHILRRFLSSQHN